MNDAARSIEELGELGRECEVRERRVLGVLGQPTLLDAAREVVVDPPASTLTEFRRDVAADDLETGLQADLRDAGTHRAQPDHADPRDLHGARSYVLRALGTRDQHFPPGAFGSKPPILTVAAKSSRVCDGSVPDV